MKTRFNSKTSTKLTAVIAVIALMGSLAGCSATITAETTEARERSEERETTTDVAETTTEAASQETTTEANSSDATVTDPQNDTSADSSGSNEDSSGSNNNSEVSYPEVISSIDDNLFGIDIPSLGEDYDSSIEYIVNIREGDIIEAESEYNTLLIAGPADSDVVYIVYKAELDAATMNLYADVFENEGYVLDLNTGRAFTGTNDEGFRVVAQTDGSRTTVAVYNSAENPDSIVAGLG